MITYSEIPHFGDCNNGHGFFFGQGTGIMQENATMETEQSVSDYWRGPNIDLHEFIGEVCLSMTLSTSDEGGCDAVCGCGSWT